MFQHIKNVFSKYKTFIKYVGLQLAVYALDLLIFAIALIFMSPAFSQALGKFLCGFISFFGQKIFVFENSRNTNKHQGFKYFLLWLINIPVTAGLVGLLYSMIEHAYISKITVDIMAFIANYIIAKTLIFKMDKNVSD